VLLFAILQKYDFSSKSQQRAMLGAYPFVVCDTAKVRFFKQITTRHHSYECGQRCLRYCKSTIFQANHNYFAVVWKREKLFAILQKYDFSSKSQLGYGYPVKASVVCDTAKVRFFKQITTAPSKDTSPTSLFAILQKYDFSSKSQLTTETDNGVFSCLRYCKSTIFQANHNHFN